MAPTALRLPAPHLLPPQHRPRFLPPAPSSIDHSTKRRWQLACSSDPHQQHHQRPSNDDDLLRAEISPSVLRALQPQDTSSSPETSGESLIEKNLRKRAMARESSSLPVGDVNTSSPILGTGDQSSMPEKQGSHAAMTSSKAEQQASPSSTASGTPVLERSSDPAYGGHEPIPRYATSTLNPITAAFWQERAPGFDMEDFHNIDFYAWSFRFSLLLNVLVAEDPEALTSVSSSSSLLWLLLPTDGFSSFLFERKELFFPGWNKDVAYQVDRLIKDKDALSGAIESFSALWRSEAWIKRAASGKASEFVLVLAYSAYVYLLSQVDVDSSRIQKKLEEYSLGLNQALTKLHGQILDPLEIWEKALKGTSLALEGTVFVYDYALIFPCKLKSADQKAAFGSMMEEVQSRLDREFKDSDLTVLLRRSSNKKEEFFILMAPWYWVLTVDSKQLTPIPGLLCLLSCFATAQFSQAGFDFGFSWDQYANPLGWTVILASIYFINDRRFPTVIPFPSLGAIGKLSSDYGVLSSRSSLVTAVLKSSCAPLSVSFLFLAFGFSVWGPLHYDLASIVDFRDHILVPPDLFSYSSILTKLLQSTSIATVQVEDGSSKLVASPFVVSGLLGLSFTAFTLFPGMHTDGGSILRSLLTSKKLANRLNMAFTVLLTVCLCTKNPSLGLGWLAVAYLSSRECIVKDDVSDTDVLPSLAASVLVMAALACFIPVLQ